MQYTEMLPRAWVAVTGAGRAATPLPMLAPTTALTAHDHCEMQTGFWRSHTFCKHANTRLTLMHVHLLDRTVAQRSVLAWVQWHVCVRSPACAKRTQGVVLLLHKNTLA